MSTCCICSNLVSTGSTGFWDRPLFESASFVVLPSLGSLIEGWLLLIPKQHFISMGALPPELAIEMARMKSEIATRLRHVYGWACAFEHGPTGPSRNVGCTVDHAHLHLVPIGFDLATAAVPFMPPDAVWSPAAWESCHDAYEAGLDYLYVEQPLGEGRIATSPAFGSQILRKAIAASLGVPEHFNWREYPEIEVAARTIRTLTKVPEGALQL